MSSCAYAFEINTTQAEENKMLKRPMVGDLAVGVKGLIESYVLGCVRKGKLYLHSHELLEVDPKGYYSYYEITMEVDGGFAVTYSPSKDGYKTIPVLNTFKCDKVLENNAEAIFYPVNSINGFTDRRSFILDLINRGYEY